MSVLTEPRRGATTGELQDEIRRIARERNAVILAHNYQRPEAKTGADTIVFCGVHFMAETAAILSPQKTVLLPDLAAGCSLAATITAQQLRDWKAEHPGAVVVSYVNTSAEVKAETDYCCTSGNAVDVINAIPADREILFLPDMFLGAHVRRMTGRDNIHVWMGECHVHAGIDPDDLTRQRAEHPGAELLVHPECGCTTSVLEAISAGDLAEGDVRVLSTEGMMRRPAQSPANEFIVATEVGILYRLRRENPGKQFFAANDQASCVYMKVTTLPKVLRALERNQHRIVVAPDIADRARLAIERMVSIGGAPATVPADPGE